MRTFNLLALSVFTASASATDFNGIIRAHLKERQLAGDDSALACLMGSSEELTGSLPTIMSSLSDPSALLTICPDGIGNCDLSTTDLATAVKAQCAEIGGKMFEENISMCRSTIDDLKAAIPDLLTLATAGEEEPNLEITQADLDMVNTLLDSIQEVSITGIPICLDSAACSDDLDLFPAMASLVDTLVTGLLAVDEDMLDDEKAIVQVMAGLMTDILEGKDCSGNNDPAGSTTSSSSVIGKFAPVALALAAALFAL